VRRRLTSPIAVWILQERDVQGKINVRNMLLAENSLLVHSEQNICHFVDLDISWDVPVDTLRRFERLPLARLIVDEQLDA
jgi:hypothetical protein